MAAPRTALLFAGLGAVLFSGKAVLVKLCYRHGADPETVLALRMLFSLPFFWLAVWWYTATKNPAPMTRADTLRILALGFFGYYLSSYLNFLGLQHVSVGLERIILYLNPTIVLLISVLFLGKHIAPRQWLAMGIAYLGVTLVFVHDVRFDGGRVLLGGALVFLCAITYAIYLIMAGQIVHRVGSLRLVAYASGSSTVFCVLQALLTDPRALVQQDAAVYGLSLINASLCTFVPMLLIMMAVHRIGPSLTAQAGVVGPVATVLLGWYFLGEPIGGLQLLGMAVVIGSVALLMTVSAAPAAPAFSGD